MARVDTCAAPTVFIASDPDSQTIVVAHQGTDPHNILSIANDIQFAQVDANTTRFPQASGTSFSSIPFAGTITALHSLYSQNLAGDVKLHSGFQDTQGRTSGIVLSTVQSGLSSTNFKRVLVTGHSLGAAIASLDAAMPRMALPDDVQVQSVVFGLPRVGNQAWADLLDSLVCGPSLAAAREHRRIYISVV